MRKILHYCGMVLAFTCVGGQALAASGPSRCAGSDDVYALRAAAVQQRLMVAALTCHAVDNYNKFVIGYRKDLQASDAALERFFRRLNGATGTADYHSFKTRLANASSMQSIRETDYCANAEATFAEALSARNKSLRIFLADKPTEDERGYGPCPVYTASAAKAPARK
jgi:hypothetical protein